MKRTYEYIAVKIKALPHWLWFTPANVTETDDQFVGVEGWGENGHAVSVNVPVSTIEGRIESDVLMHAET